MQQALGQVKQAIPVRYRQQLRAAVRRARELSRRLRNDRMVVIIGSANRVGSTWLYDMIAQLGHFQGGYERLERGYQEAGCVVLGDQAVLSHMRVQPGYTIYKTHSYPIGATGDDRIKLVSIYRDPRDVITSNIFSLTHLRDFEIKLGDGDFRQLSEQARIQAFVRDAEYCVAKLERWYRDPHSYRVQYERLKREPVAVLHGVTEALELRVSRYRIARVVEANAFARASGRQPGQERRDSPMRKGIVGDWRNYFDAACIEAFKTAQGGRWNDLLLEMGYEQTPDWS
jgi:Sulfotransferase domain